MHSFTYFPVWLLAATQILASPLGPRSDAQTSTHKSGGDEYIVLLAKNALVRRDHQTVDVLSRLDLTPDHPDVHHVYDNDVFHGFVANMGDHCLNLLHNMSDVTHVEKNMMVQTTVVKRHGPVRDLPYLDVREAASATRPDSPWGLQRISSSASMAGSDPDAEAYTYTSDTNVDGSNVDVYIVDTGIYTQHSVFQGRASIGWAADESDPGDSYGHGTHCAGTAAGALVGVASGAKLIAIKALQDTGAGAVSDVVNGIQQAVSMHQKRMQDQGFVGSVMSMSFGLLGTSEVMSSVVMAASEAKMHIALAAGNDATDACSFAPAVNGGVNSDAIVTVGSVGIDGPVSSFSNTGQCVDVYAPGEHILSAAAGYPQGGKFMDGTSMATPHVAGTMAYLMSKEPGLGRDPAGLKKRLLDTALRGHVSNDPNLLLLNNGWT